MGLCPPSSSLFFLHTFHNPSFQKPVQLDVGFRLVPLTLHAFCGLQDWLFLCPQAQDGPMGLTSPWLGRYSNRQALTGTLQGNLSSPAEHSTDPFPGRGGGGQQDTWAEKLFFPGTSSSDSLSDPAGKQEQMTKAGVGSERRRWRGSEMSARVWGLKVCGRGLLAFPREPERRNRKNRPSLPGSPHSPSLEAAPHPAALTCKGFWGRVELALRQSTGEQQRSTGNSSLGCKIP